MRLLVSTISRLDDQTQYYTGTVKQTWERWLLLGEPMLVSLAVGWFVDGPDDVLIERHISVARQEMGKCTRKD